MASSRSANGFSEVEGAPHPPCGGAGLFVVPGLCLRLSSDTRALSAARHLFLFLHLCRRHLPLCRGQPKHSARHLAGSLVVCAPSGGSGFGPYLEPAGRNRNAPVRGRLAASLHAPLLGAGRSFSVGIGAQFEHVTFSSLCLRWLTGRFPSLSPTAVASTP